MMRISDKSERHFDTLVHEAQNRDLDCRTKLVRYATPRSILRILATAAMRLRNAYSK